MENGKRLYRSRTQKVIGGVAGGLAEYFNIDVILMRLLFVAIVLAGGSGVLIYIILWIVVPLEPYDHMEKKIKYERTFGNQSSENAKEQKSNNRTFIIGVSLILLGLIFLLNSLFPYLFSRDLWPVVLIFIGIMILVNETSRANKEEPFVSIEDSDKENDVNDKKEENNNDIKL